MKKILVAFDSFKDSISAKKAGEIVIKAFKSVNPDFNLVNLPIADGGEGTVDSLVDATNGRTVHCKVSGPLGNQVDSYFGISNDSKTAFIEMAKASGIELLGKDERNPMLTSTFGTGELILKALDLGVEKIIIGIGGSATNDAGVGMAVALGAKIYGDNNNEIMPIPAELRNLTRIDLSEIDERLENVCILAACDVTNPLLGKNGSSHTYGPQKGADPALVEELDEILRHIKNIIGVQAELDANVAGAGAAGGLGFGILTFCKGTLQSGFGIINDFLKLSDNIKNSSLVITGEGQMDFQSIMGKGPIEICKIAKTYGIPSLAIVGSLGRDFSDVYDHGVTSVFSVLNSISPLEEALSGCNTLLYDTAVSIARLLDAKISL